MAALLVADESQVGACRKFIREHCDPEYLAVYDIFWAGNDERRQEQIGALQDMDLVYDTADASERYAEDGVRAATKIAEDYRSNREKRASRKDDMNHEE